MNNSAVWLVPALVLLAVVLIGTAILRLRKDRSASELAKRRAMQDHGGARGAGTRPRLIFTGQRAGEFVSRGRMSKSLREKLAAAGYHGSSAAAIYLGSKVLLLVVVV